MRHLAIIALFCVVSTARAEFPVSSLDQIYGTLIEEQRRGALHDRLAPGGIAFAPRKARRPTARAMADRLGASLRPRLTFIGQETDVQLRPDFLDLRTGDAVDPFARLRVGFVGRARFHEHVTAGVDFAFDSRGDNDPRNRTRSFEQLDASNNFDAAWLRAHFARGALTVGRVPFQWGPERGGGLLISDLGPALDMIHGRLDWGPHVLQSFAAQLSSEVVDDEFRRRWLYGHRADVFFFDARLRVALSEVVVVAGTGEGLSLRYLNPIPMWTQVQVEEDGDAAAQINAIQAIDATWTQDLGQWTARTYGSLAVDDFQIDAEGRDRNPDQLAWAAGLDLSRGAWLWGYEARRIGTWTYLHRGEGTDHRNYGRPLGAPEGPDGDLHDLRLDWRGSSTWSAFAGVARRRRGENRIDTAETRLGQVDQPFPRGTVETRWITALGLRYERPGTAKAALQAAFHSISNVNNEVGVDDDVFELRIVVDVFLPALAGFVD